MKVIIAEVGIDSKVGLFVCPPASEDYTFIWRDASGIRWNKECHALVAYEPERWEPVELFKQIIAAVKSEYGDDLELGPSAKWTNVPPDLCVRIAR